MFLPLLEELINSTPQTEVQRARILRAQAEGESYRYEDCSAVYEEPAVRVHTLSGSDYLCFPNQCTCRDWEERGPVLGTDEIEICKHIAACHINGQFVDPPQPSGEEGPADDWVDTDCGCGRFPRSLCWQDPHGEVNLCPTCSEPGQPPFPLPALSPAARVALAA